MYKHAYIYIVSTVGNNANIPNYAVALSGTTLWVMCCKYFPDPGEFPDIAECT